jgi:hypothetical protein
MRQSILMASVLLCALATLASCGGPAATTIHPSPTVTGTPTYALTWREVTLPQGASLASNTNLTVAPSPAQVVWACTALSHQQFDIWALRAPSGSSWQQTGTITTSVPPITGRCLPIADRTDPHTLAVIFEVGSGDVAGPSTRSYISTDDGAHWRQVGDMVHITDMAEIGGKTIALLSDAGARPGAQGLVISSDHLRTWSSVTMPPAEASDIERLWVSPTGDMLAVTRSKHLWRSQSQGMTWERMNDYFSDVGFAAWLPVARTWHVCFDAGVTSDELRCTDDLGKSWEEAPRLTQSSGCGQCKQGAQPKPCRPQLMADDGTTFASCDMNSAGPPQQAMLMMLRLNGREWVNLGVVPGSVLAAWDGGTLWSLDGQTGKLYVTHLSA